jgi:L-aminopeptidase/D-esterase-like protein
MAHDGFARVIYPVHTPADGDVIFALSTASDTGAVDITRIGSLAAQVMADAVLRAVTQATGLPGYPAVRDLKQ